MGLKNGNFSVYRASKLEFRRADTGRGCRSSSSVGGGYFSGRIRCRNDTGSCVSLARNIVKPCGGVLNKRLRGLAGMDIKDCPTALDN